jgi:hypothetical protein
MGRKKQFERGYSRSDAMRAIGYDRPNNSRMNRVLRLLPNREDSMYLTGPEVFYACLLDQCLDCGCDDSMASRYSKMAFDAVGDDLLAGCDADGLGYLVIFQGLHEVLRATYIHAGDETSVSDFFVDGRLADGRACTGVIQLDLGELLVCVRERLARNIESFQGKKYSAQEIADALKSAKSLIDQIEAVHK